jgi:hypothetical protein
MRLSRVPALRALDTTDFYLRCDACDYTSGQLTGIASGEFACDIHQEADCKLKPSDPVARCEHEVATLVRASGTKSADQSLRGARLRPIRGLGASSNFDRPVPPASLPHPAALSVVATFLVISAIAASLVSYFAGSPSVLSLLSIPTLAPSETERVVLSSLGEAEEPSIKSKTTTTGSATEPKAPTTPFEEMMHPERTSIDTKMVDDPGDRTTADSRSAKGQSSAFNPLALHRNVDPTLDAEGTEFPDVQSTGGSVGSDMATARPPSTRAESTSLVTGVPLNRTGFTFGDSDVRYLSRTELEKLSPEQLRLARHEILARKGRFFKDPRLSVHFRAFSWYQPSAWRVRLNAIEQANVGLILSIEASPNHWHRPDIALQNQN